MASSYRRHATTAMMPVMEVKRAESPKAFGPYMRVIIGDASILRACAIAVAPASLITSKRKDDDCIRFLTNGLVISVVCEFSVNWIPLLSQHIFNPYP